MSPADTAYAKIRKVYPFINRTNFRKHATKDLLEDKDVAKVLGKQIEIRAVTASDFYQQLQYYVDSGEPERADSTTQSTRMRYWPLVNVAKVYLKHRILETGVTLVDIPGGHDHNAARATSAAKYASSCSAYFLVSKVDRATDDGFVMKMMGEAFRRQLRLDSGIMNDSLVTFVCTQADNVSFTEMKEFFSDEVADYMEAWNSEHRDQHEIQKKVSKLELELDNVTKKQKQAADDEVAASAKSRNLRRKRKADDSDNGTLITASDRERMSAEQDEIADQCSETQEECRSRASDISQELEHLRARLSTSTSNLNPADLSNAMCLRVRGDMIKKAIRAEVAKDIKQIDEQFRSRSGETEGELIDYRDYAQVARDLPVFVVSSKAYQVLSGHQQDDKFAIRGFLDIEDTELPTLQEHCRSLAFRARELTCKRTLTQTDMALTSIIMWTGHGGTREALSPQEMESNRAVCNYHLDNL